MKMKTQHIRIPRMQLKLCCMAIHVFKLLGKKVPKSILCTLPIGTLGNNTVSIIHHINHLKKNHMLMSSAEGM